MDTFKNPLEMVQFIPIFSYLNILSDFLFTEQCLQENDQNKQIPIVNALYEYLQRHEHNEFKKIELIRTLLQGSDLYGEKDDEYFDVTFVNAMFDYIINSLVFDKYGNIYGFLATIFCKAENLQLYEILNVVMIELENASFENEYGDSSNLNILSVGRICNELILPLFPRLNANLSLLSLDYIYAQAGLMFLRPGRMDTTYYSDFEDNVPSLIGDDLFDEYLATGHVIEKLILTEESNLKMLKAFALPALSYYIFNSKYLFVYENMAHVISDSDFWQTAYKQLFQYTAKIFSAVEIELKNDFTLEMHNCTLNEIKFLYENQNESSKLINSNTRSLLSSVGTSIRSVFLKNASYETVDKIVTKQQEYRHLLTDALNNSEIFEDISQHIGGPAFQLTFATKDKINMVKKIINSLKEKINFKFTSVRNSLSKMSILKSNFFRSVGTIGRNRSRLIFVNTLDNKSDTGYGYKFIFLSDDISRIAELRTGYELKDQRLLSLILDSPKNETKYIILNDINFQPQPGCNMYKINNQLRRKPTKVSFSGIPIQPDDSYEKCSDDRYFEKWKHLYVCQRRQRSSQKFKYEEDAVEFVKKNTNLSEKEIRNTLGKFTFPDNVTLTQFVDYWLKNKSLTEPGWSRGYIIDNPDLLSHLRYTLRFENHNVSEYDGIFRINALYSTKERRKIEEGTSLETIIKDFNEQKATYSVTFHDYYAIRNFASTGYRRITSDTWEAKFMKTALYKLAIRQSDDAVEEYDLKLFRIESQPVSFYRITSSKADFQLKKFTPAFPNIESAIRFAGYPAPGFMNIVYEMIFHGPYMRAKIEQFYEKKEENIILLPGSEFLITDGERVNIGELGTVLKLTLKLKHNSNEKYIWYKNIMNEIGHTQF